MMDEMEASMFGSEVVLMDLEGCFDDFQSVLCVNEVNVFCHATNYNYKERQVFKDLAVTMRSAKDI